MVGLTRSEWSYFFVVRCFGGSADALNFRCCETKLWFCCSCWRRDVQSNLAPVKEMTRKFCPVEWWRAGKEPFPQRMRGYSRNLSSLRHPGLPNETETSRNRIYRPCLVRLERSRLPKTQCVLLASPQPTATIIIVPRGFCSSLSPKPLQTKRSCRVGPQEGVGTRTYTHTHASIHPSWYPLIHNSVY